MNVLGKVGQFVRQKPFVRGTYLSYFTIVGLGFLKGSYAGHQNYETWKESRPRVTIHSTTYDPIINTCRDIGVWGYNVLVSGFGSAGIVATAPVSVPILLACSHNTTPGTQA